MKNVPEIRFRGFDGEWEAKKLGDLLEFKNGLNADKNAYGSGVKFINVLDILNNNYITYDNIIGKVNISEEIFNKYRVDYGDVLFQRSSETREEVGTANVYLDSKPATFGGFVIRGKKIGEYNPMFINNALKSKTARREITTRSGGSTRYNVGQDILSVINIIMPKMDEQERIANFFAKVDKLIEKQDEKVKNYELYKKGMMQKIFSQEIRFRGDKGEEYPEWEEKILGDFLNFYSTNSYSRDCLNDIDGEVKNIHYGDIHMKFSTIVDVSKVEIPYINPNIDLSKIPKEAYCKEGDVVIADASEDYEDIGKTIELINISDEKIVSGLHTILGRDIEGITQCGYRGYMFQDYSVKKQMKVLAAGAKVLGISKSNIAKISVKIPCLEEQSKISNFLCKIDALIEKEQEKLENYRSWKKGLLQGIFV